MVRIATIGGGPIVRAFVAAVDEVPGIELAEALVVAERLRTRLATTTVAHGGHVLTFTVCAGVSQRVASDTGIGSLLQRADQALYAAKQAGRNQVAAQGD